MVTGSGDFDEELADALVDAWTHLRRGMLHTCHVLADEQRRLAGWSGRARDAWDNALAARLHDGLDLADEVAGTIDDLVDRHERWVFETRRVDGSGR